MGVIMKNKINYTGFGGGGGGGSAKYTEKELWSGTQSTTGTITLSESVKNFSIIMLMISAHPDNTNYYKTPWYILVSEITDYATKYQFEPFGVRGANNVNSRACMLSLHFTSETSILIDEADYGSQAKPTLLKVIGIKWETMQTALIYSEEEREVGVWTDGKPLYAKTVSFTVTNGNGYTTYAHNIANVIPIAVEGEVYSSTGETIYTEGANAAANLSFAFGTSYVYFYQNSTYFNNYTARARLYYTKTTDTPGSGIWTTTGEYAHHYSTDEHVVGTWIDGSTIYERTWNGLNQSVTANAWNVITGISIANLGIVIDARAYRTSGQGLTGLGVRAFQNSGNSSNNPQIVPLESQTLVTLILQYTKTA